MPNNSSPFISSLCGKVIATLLVKTLPVNVRYSIGKYCEKVFIPVEVTIFFLKIYLDFVNIKLNMFSTVISTLLLAQYALCAPISEALYQPSSAMFSLIALHNGAQFQSNLVKFDGSELKLVADDKAFFGRIKANNGYVLNIPSPGQGNTTTLQPSNTNVKVDNDYRMTTTTVGGDASEDFGLENSLLIYQGSNQFLACPDDNYRGEYSVYFNHDNNTACPFDAIGYNITLLAQMDSTINYSNETNINAPN